MQPKASLLIKILLNRFHPGAAGPALLKYLPKEESNAILEHKIDSTDVVPLLTFYENILERTHYSWMAPAFQKLPLWKQQLYVNALPEAQASGLRQYLKIPDHKAKYPPALKAFMLSKLSEIWQPDKEVMPLSYLPQSPLSPLLSLQKNHLVEVIDLLSMHDLAESIRHIVDKKQLKAIYNCLSPIKQQYLRTCLHLKDRITAPKLELEKWNGTAKALENELHRRGMLRFGKALCGQHPQFFWYLMRTLDTGRGATLARYYQEEPIQGITPLLAQQVLSLINFIQQKGNS